MSEARFHNQLGDEYELFKLACPHYDELQNSIGNLIKENFSNSTINPIKVLELGFGAGATSIVILNSDKRVVLTAVDNETLMLKKAKLKLDTKPQSRYTLIEKDALSFLKGLEEGSFDVVASAWVLHNFLKDYREKVIKEIFRVLKPGGIFINADKVETSDRDQHEKNRKWQLAQFEIYEKIGKPELKREWTQHYFEDGQPERVLIENDFEKSIKSAGFNSFRVVKRWYDDAAILIKK